MRAVTVGGPAQTVEGIVRTVGVTADGNAAFGNERKPKRI